MVKKDRRNWWLVLLLGIGTCLGWAGHHFLAAPGECPPVEYMAIVTEGGWGVTCGEVSDYLEQPPIDCDECIIEVADCEPEVIHHVQWRDRDCPEPEPCPECEVCPIPVWNCSDNPCPADCPELEPEIEVRIVEKEVPVIDWRHPNITIAWENDYEEVVCYYDFPDGPIEAARLDLGTQLEFREDPRFAARLGYGERDVVAGGLSVRLSRRWGAHVGAHWMTDPEKVYCSQSFDIHGKFYGPPQVLTEDDVRVVGGVEVRF